MPALDNQKHEAFALAVACGMSATQAYREKVSGGKCLTATAMSEGCRLLATPKVSTRVEELRAEAKKRAEEKFGVTVETLIRFHVEVIETPLSEIAKDHRLAQEYSVTREGGTKIKAISKSASASELAKLCGYYAPDKIEATLPQTAPEELAQEIQNRVLELHGKADVVRRILAQAG